MARRVTTWVVVIIASAGLGFGGGYAATHTTSPSDNTTGPTGGPSPSPVFSQAVQKPDQRWTPGRIRTVNAEDLCPLKTERVDLTDAQKATVLRRYHLPEQWAFESPQVHVAEWDHYLALGAGGDNGVYNIWPQLYVDQRKRKDAFEAKIHADICGGRITVTEAQAQEKEFWRHW